jgi:hypothetical protein
MSRLVTLLVTAPLFACIVACGPDVLGPSSVSSLGSFRLTIDGPPGPRDLRIQKTRGGYGGTLTNAGSVEPVSVRIDGSNIAVAIGDRTTRLHRTATESTQSFRTVSGVPFIDLSVKPGYRSVNPWPEAYSGLVGPHQESVTGRYSPSATHGQISVFWSRNDLERKLVINFFGEGGRAKGTLSSFDVETHSLSVEWSEDVKFDVPREQPFFFVTFILHLLLLE